MNRVKEFFLSLSIHKKLAIGIFCIISFIFISTALIALNVANKQTTTIVKELIDSNIKSNEDFIITTLLAGDSWELFKFLKALTKNSTIQSAGIIDKDKKIVAHSKPKKYRVGDIFNSFENKKIIPLDYNGINLGSIVLKVESGNIKEMLKSILLQNVIFFLLTVVLSFIIASVSIKRFLDRFKIILSNMNAISQKKWDQIKSNKSDEKDEITSLIDQSIVFMNEIKQSVKKEEAMRLFYRDILKSIDSFIVICDKDMKITYHNNHFLSGVLLEKNKTAFLNRELQSIKKKFLKQNSFIYNIEDSLVSHLFVNIQHIDDKIVINFSDITKIKEKEENEKVMHSLQLLGEISSQFAHEIKNLLQPLTLLIPKNELPDKEDISIINLTLKKMKEQISDFLQLGKPVLVDSNIKVDVVLVLKEVLVLFEKQIANKGIVIKQDLPKDLFVQLNKKHIEMIVVNLVKNAIEASFENESIDILCKQNQENSILIISNKGNKIEDTKKIFNPFYTTKQDGSGLGLFLIYKIIHTIKGSIDIQSKNDLTTFIISIPNRIEI